MKTKETYTPEPEYVQFDADPTLTTTPTPPTEPLENTDGTEHSNDRDPPILEHLVELRDRLVKVAPWFGLEWLACRYVETIRVLHKSSPVRGIGGNRTMLQLVHTIFLRIITQLKVSILAGIPGAEFGYLSNLAASSFRR